MGKAAPQNLILQKFPSADFFSPKPNPRPEVEFFLGEN
jgi:hypothetical protein